MGLQKLILNIILLPLLGNEQLNTFLHISKLATIINYILPISLFGCLVYDSKGQNKYKLNLISVLSLIFIVILFLSWNFSICNKIYNVSNFIKFSLMIYFLYILNQIEFSQKQKKIINYSIIYLLIFVCIIGVLQYIFKLGINLNGIEKYPGARGRINSTFYIATIYDKYLLINILYCLFLLKNNLINKALVIIAFCLANLNLFFTFCRTSQIIILIVYFIMIIYLFIKKRKHISILIILMILLSFIIPGQNYLYSATAKYFEDVVYKIDNKTHTNILSKITKPIFNIFIIKVDNNSNNGNNSIEQNPNQTNSSDNQQGNDIQLIENIDYSLNSRKYFKSVAKNIMKSNPTLGIGIGSYNYIYENQNASDYIKDKSFDTTSRYLYPHNMYYQLGAEIGILGMLIFFTIILYYLLKNKNLFSIMLLVIIILSCHTESIFYMKDVAYFNIFITSLFASKNFNKKDKN